jgi:DNA-binding FrmR family transcriptional regulator
MGHLSQDDALIKRVRRIAGQVGALERALADGADCATTLHLAAAARGAMNGLMDRIIQEHLHAHVAGPGLSDPERAAGADDLIAAIRRYAK